MKNLYVHIPWCRSKCPYCDFNSFATATIPEQEYLTALKQDLQSSLTIYTPQKLTSIFIGGGTPSLLSATTITELIAYINTLIPFANNIEITLEANPGTLNKPKIIALKNAGINRLSIGVQSFQNDQLKALGRIHNQQQATAAIKQAQDIGLDNINIDLMYGLPNQNETDAIADLELALSFNIQHLSWYQLTIELGTLFAKSPPALPDEDTIWQIITRGKKLIKNNNFKQYEISAYCKKNYQCKHNLNYWQYGDYLGIGAGAHSKITINNKIIRSKKHSDPKHYMNHKNGFVSHQEILNPQQIQLEFMMNALRLYKPISIKLFAEKTGLHLNSIKPTLIKAQQQKLLTWNEQNIITTQKGKIFLNELLKLFA